VGGAIFLTFRFIPTSLLLSFEEEKFEKNSAKLLFEPF